MMLPDSSSAIERVHAAIEVAGYRRQGRNWTCSAHDDRNPSISITEGDDGRVRVHSHAGCTQQAVMAAPAAQGFNIHELINAADSEEYRHPELGSPLHTWRYNDAERRLVRLVARFETANGKTFRPLMAPGRPLAGTRTAPAVSAVQPARHSRRPRCAGAGVRGRNGVADAAAEKFPDTLATTPCMGRNPPTRPAGRNSRAAKWRCDRAPTRRVRASPTRWLDGRERPVRPRCQ